MVDRALGQPRLIASPAWPAPMTTAVVRTGAGVSCREAALTLTSTVTLVGLVMMS